MTDEKKKPEEDEVSDEQLDDVAGGLTAALRPMSIRQPVVTDKSAVSDASSLPITDPSEGTSSFSESLGG